MAVDRFDFYCDNYGFVRDKDLSELNGIIGRRVFERLHIDTYLEKPYALLLRSIENSAVASIVKDRIVIHKNDRSNTSILNIPIVSIDNCLTKWYGDSKCEVMFTVHNITYKIFIVF